MSSYLLENSQFCEFVITAHQIDGNQECVHSQHSCILTSQVSTQFLCPTKLLIKMKILG